MHLIESGNSGLSYVFATHGVVDTVNANLFVKKGLIEAAQFARHIQNREHLYVDLESALKGSGDALTIDDATQAAYDAAVIARRYGHQVTLFINPYNVIHQQEYFFTQLSAVMDRANRSSVSFLGIKANLGIMHGRRILREQVKHKLMTLATETERCRLVQDLARELGVDDYPVPKFLRILNVKALHELKTLGVRIANHGWTHASVDALPPQCTHDEIVNARNWIEREMEIEANIYAVPFGHSLPRFRLQPEVCGTWLLNDELINTGYIGTGIFNRKTLRVECCRD